ncbi:MAG: formyltetrahydrofolate deformylase [Candidatus Tokpelaia sp. JSC161]|jgi:formyltetrahydrofolate deformylase|nr:MAG: formyltetrahydrofolate deformylase [Candidatus Tokpelaia sp. JSC161]
MNRLILTVSCHSTRGVVASIAEYLANNGCNIVDSSQFDDLENGKFFMRVTFISEEGQTIKELSENFIKIRQKFTMRANFYDEQKKTKVILMVSRFGHCLNDLLYRWKINALPIDIVAVVSNHLDYQEVVLSNGISFYYLQGTAENKDQTELKKIIRKTQAELIVLARYMQVLSCKICHELKGRIINIHHSFLPSFKGANPYRQAYKRGVKLIGATAHYVTKDLDEGPIIEQDVARITHAQNANDYTSIGRDIEAQVLARAVLAHIQHRTFINGTSVVVFPASSGSYSAT